MSNPYKEIVQKLVNSSPYFTLADRDGFGYEQCFYCGAEHGYPHALDCLYLQAKTLQEKENE